MFSISLFRLSSVVRPRKRMVWRPWNTTSAYCFRECPRIPREKLSPLIVTWMTLTSTSIMETSASSVNKIWSKSQSFTLLMFCLNCLHCFRDIPKLMLNQSFCLSFSECLDLRIWRRWNCLEWAAASRNIQMLNPKASRPISTWMKAGCSFLTGLVPDL